MTDPNPAQRGDKQMVLMFTDVVDSVAIKRRIGDPAYLAALHAHLQGLKAAILAEPGASVIKSTGDGLLARFATPGDAVRAALRAQAAIAAAPEAERLPDRIGIHSGVGFEITDPNGNPDVAGLAVDMAARVMGLCGTGQILLTRAAFDDARQFVREHPGGAGFQPASSEVPPAGKMSAPPSLQWMAHGPYLFKGADEALEVFEVGTTGIAPLRAPGNTEKARRAITPGDEQMYDWRPAVGQALPRRDGWLLERKLGEGGFGEVWLAKQRKTGDRRVFKFCFDADRLRSFRRELTLFRLLREALGDRKDIARIFDVHLEHPPFFLESEYSPGGDLYDWAVAKGGIGTLPLEQRLDLLRRIAEAVAAAHSVGVLHKDLKPSNVLMDAAEDGSPRPKLADFGIGILADRSRLEGAQFTIAGFTAGQLTMNDSSRTGTRLYSPPETMTSVRTTDGSEAKPAPFTAKGDVYALGVMLYQFVIGDLDRPLAIGWERSVESAVKEPLLRRVLTSDIAEMVEGDPERRTGSATEVERLIGSVAERRAQAEREEIAARAAEEANRRAEVAETRRKRTRLLAAAAVVLVAAVATASLYFLSRESDLREKAEESLAEKQRAEERVRSLVEQRMSEVKGRFMHHMKNLVPLEPLYTEGAALLAEMSAHTGDVTEELRTKADAFVPRMQDALMAVEEAFKDANTFLKPGDTVSLSQGEADVTLALRPGSMDVIEWHGIHRPTGKRAEGTLDIREVPKGKLVLVRMATRLGDFSTAELFLRWTGLPPDESAQVKGEIDTARGAVLAHRRERIRAALDDLAAGLGRKGRPRTAPLIEDYVFELSSYRDPQTVEILGAALGAFVEKAKAQVDPSDKRRVQRWDPSDRDVITLCCRVLGRLDQGAAAVDALVPFSRVATDHSMAIEVAGALGKTNDPGAWTPLLDMARRFGLWSGTGNSLLFKGTRLPAPRVGDPSTADDMISMGLWQLAVARKFDEAMACITRASQLDVLSADALVYRGMLLASKGKTDEAMLEFRRALELRPDDAVAMGQVANCHAELEEMDKAIAAYSKTIELDPSFAENIRTRGGVKEYMGDLTGAMEDYSMALKVDPRHAPSFLSRGFACQNRGDTARAIEDYTRATEENPASEEPWLYRAKARLVLRDFDGAIHDCGRALDVKPSETEALVVRAMAHAAQNSPESALDDCNYALRMDGDLVLAYAVRIQIRRWMQDVNGATADQDRVEQLAQGDAWAQCDVARMLAVLSSARLPGSDAMTDEAFAWLSRAADTGSADPPWVSVTSVTDFAPLRTDPRWPGIVERIKASAEKKKQAAKPETPAGG